MTNILEELGKIDNLEDLDIILDKIDEIDIMSPDETYLLNEMILLKNTLYRIISAQKDKIVSDNKLDLNLTHLFSKHLFSARRIKLVSDTFPDLNRQIGCVPEIFLEKSENKEKTAKNVFDILARYSQILNYDYSEEGYDKILDKYMLELSAELAKETAKDIKLLFLGHGVNGNGFKLSVGGKNYFYKVFFPHNKFHNANINYLHGAHIEPAFAMFAMKNAPKHQFVKYYMGKIASKYDRDAFMLTDFLETDYTRPNETIKIDYIQLKESEIKRFDNLLEGKIVDFGGMFLNKNKDFQNPKIRKLIRVILNNISYSHDSEKFQYTWRITDRNTEILKTFIKKYDREEYKTAIDVIKAETKISEKILEFLCDIENSDEGVFDSKILKINDIFSTDLNSIKEKVNEFSVIVKTESEPYSDQFDGYLMLGVRENVICIIFYDINKKIKKIKIEKETNGVFDKIIELEGEQIEGFEGSEPFYTLLDV